MLQALPAIVLLVLSSIEALAQNYPNRPVRVLVGSSAGGGGDILARTIGQKMADSLGQSFVVDDRGGAGGAIACEIVAKAAPDGYTLLIASVGMLAINPGLYPRLQYFPRKDFLPVTLLDATPYILVANPAVPVKSVKELVALAKARAGQLTVASGGTGTGNHLSAELLQMAAGIKLVHVPYKGTGPALTDVLGGQVQLMFINLLPSMPHIRAGRLRGLAVTSLRRSAVAPDVPTIAESGFAGFETAAWHGLLTPAGTPKAIVTRLYGEAVKALRQPDVKERLASQGTDAIGSTPAQFTAYIQSETEKWAKVIKTAGIRAE